MKGIYWFLNDLSPVIFRNILHKEGKHYSLRNPRSLVPEYKFTYLHTFSKNLKSGKNFKIFNSLNVFQSNMKRYGTLTCHCNKCKTFVCCVGYNE